MVVILAFANHGAFTKCVMGSNDPPRADILNRPVEIGRIARFFSIDENEIEGSQFLDLEQ